MLWEVKGIKFYINENFLLGINHHIIMSTRLTQIFFDFYNFYRFKKNTKKNFLKNYITLNSISY